MHYIENDITCEIINNFGILIAQKIRMSTKYIPKIGDKFEFHVRGHFRPVVIEIIKVSLDETVQKNPKTYCIGEELDGKETVRDCFNYDKFTVSW